MRSMIPSERSNNNPKSLFPEMKQVKMNFVQGEGGKEEMRMTRGTRKRLVQGRKGRDGKKVLDRQPAQVFAPGLPWSHTIPH